MRTMTALVLTSGLLACSAPPPSEATDARAVRETITREIGAATCTEHAQCATLPVGYKACGGPDAYVAWSSSVSERSPT